MGLEKLLSEVRLIVEKNRQQMDEAYRRGELYNVFNVLGVSNQELMHSAFLAALLDPNGDHGMKDTFLKAFLANNNVSLDIDTTCVKVETEHYIGTATDTTGGRIDIFITDTDNSHAIIIENKIWADDQFAQMKRYYNYGHQMYNGNFALLYLTLDGHEPCEQSRGALDSKKNDYQCISYGDDIIRWLYQCARLAFDKPHVREVISQYIDVLKQLTNQNTMEENKEKLVRLLSNENNFRQACIIADNISSVKQYLVEIVLREQLADDNRYEIRGCSYGRRNYCGIDINIPGWKYCSIKFEFGLSNGTTDLCYGIIGSQKRYTNIFNDNGYETNDLWPAWKYMEKYRYWNVDTFMAINSGAVAIEIKKRISELLQLAEAYNMDEL